MSGASRSFDPNSTDAMFAKILERLDQQDETTDNRHEENRSTLSEIKEQTELTNGRVTKLETWRTYQKGWTAGIALVVSAVGSALAWFLYHVFGK